MISCKQCENELICKYRDQFEDVQNQVTQIVSDAGKDIFYGNVECRYRRSKTTIDKGSTAEFVHKMVTGYDTWSNV